jgi:predicted Zn-dependent protease
VSEALSRADALLASRPEIAARQAAAILEVVPAHPQAELILATAHRRLGDPQRAAAILSRLAITQPRAAGVHYEWALTQAELGNTKGAVASLRHALALKPNLAQAWRALGDLHTLAGEPAAAEAAYAQHVRAGVHDPVLRQAAAALCDNDLPLAEHLLRGHLRANPTDVAALRMLAEAGTRLGRYEDAESLLTRCLELMPGFTPARHNYAVVLFRQGKAAEALPQIQMLLAEAPDNPVYRNLLAACLAMVGEHQASIAAYETVLKRVPNEPKIWLGFGHVLKTSGRRADSVHAYRACTRLAPGFGEAWWSLANLKNEELTPGDIAVMRTQLTQTGPGPEDLFHLHYALGHALERGGDYAGSFPHYAEGARLRREQVNYSADRTHAQMQRARATLTADFFASRAGWGCQDPSPIFIVGLPRAGSTLIEQILASHSAIEGTMELPEMVNIARDLGRGEDAYPAPLADLSPEQAQALGHRYLDRTRIHRKLGRPFFIDKLPNNFVHTGLIHLILPNAKIIDARRAPMASCFSAFKQHFARGQHFSYDLTELGLYYADYVALMAHFEAALPGRIHRVQYEAMVNDTEGQTRRLLTYLGLPFEPACLRFHENDRAVRTASSEQVRRPIFREGLDHWRHYEPWLAPLRAALGALAEA